MYPDLIEIPSEHVPNLTGVFYNNKKIGSIAKGHGYISNDDYKNKQLYFKTYVYDGDEFSTLGYYKTHDEAINAIQKYHFPVYRGEKVTYSLSLQNDIRILKNDSVIGLVSKFDKFEGSDRPVYMAFSALPNEKGGGAKHLRKIGNFESFSQAVQAIITQNKPNTNLSESKFSAEKVSDTTVKVTYDDTTIGTISIIFLNGKYRYVPYGLHLNKNINQHFWTMLKPEGVLNQAIKNVLDWYKDRYNIKENHTDISESVPYINEGKIRAVKVNDPRDFTFGSHYEFRIYDDFEWIGIVGVKENCEKRYGPFVVAKDDRVVKHSGYGSHNYGFHYLGGEKVLNVAIKKILDWHKRQDSSKTDIAENANRYTTKTQEDIVRVYDNGVEIGYVRRSIDPVDNKTHYWAYLSPKDGDIYIGLHSTLNKAIKTIIIINTPPDRVIIDENSDYNSYKAKKDTLDDNYTIIYKDGLEIGRIKKVNEHIYGPNPLYMVFKNYAPDFERYPFEYQYDSYGAFETFAKAVQKLIDLEPRYKYGKKPFTENTNENDESSTYTAKRDEKFPTETIIYKNGLQIGRIKKWNENSLNPSFIVFKYHGPIDTIYNYGGFETFAKAVQKLIELESKHSEKKTTENISESNKKSVDYRVVPAGKDSFGDKFDIFANDALIGQLTRPHATNTIFTNKRYNYDPMRLMSGIRSLAVGFKRHDSLKNAIKDVIDSYNEFRRIYKPYFFIDFIQSGVPGIIKTVHASDDEIGRFYKVGNLYRTYYNMDDYKPKENNFRKEIDAALYLISRFLEHHNIDATINTNQLKKRLRDMNKQSKNKNIEESSQSDTQPKFRIERYHENDEDIIYVVRKNEQRIGRITYSKYENFYSSRTYSDLTAHGTPVMIFDNLTDSIKMILDPLNMKWKEISRSQHKNLFKNNRITESKENSESDIQPKFRIERYYEDKDEVAYYVYKNNVIVGKIEYFKGTTFYLSNAYHLGSKIFDNLTDSIKMILDPTNKKWKEISRSQQEKLRKANRITESKENSQSDTRSKFSVERWHENKFHIIYSVKKNSIEIGKIDYIKNSNCYYSRSSRATLIGESTKIFDNLTDAIKMILDPTNKKWKEISKRQEEKLGLMTESNKSNNDVAYTVKHISNTKSYLMANNKIIGELLRDIKGGKTHATGYYSKNTYTLPVWGKAAATWQTFDSLLDGVKFLIHRYKEFINNFNPQFLVEQHNDIFVVKVASDFDGYYHYNVFTQISCWFNYRTGKNKYTVDWQYNTVTKQRFTGNTLYDAVIVSIEKFLDKFKIKANIDYDGIKRQIDELLSGSNQHKELTENSDQSVKYTVYRTTPNKTTSPLYNPPYFVYANGREIGNVLAREEDNAYYARSYYTKDPKEYSIDIHRHVGKEKEEFNKLTHAIKFIIDIYKNFREKFTVDLDLKQDFGSTYSATYKVSANNNTIATISRYANDLKKIYYVYGLTDSPSIQHVRTIHDAVTSIVKIFKKEYDLTDEKIDYSKLNAKLEQFKND